MIEIRCPNCNKKATETAHIHVLLTTVCYYCSCKYIFKDGKYTHEPPRDYSKRLRYEKYKKLPYQQRMNLNKK